MYFIVLLLWVPWLFCDDVAWADSLVDINQGGKQVATIDSVRQRKIEAGLPVFSARRDILEYEELRAEIDFSKPQQVDCHLLTALVNKLHVCTVANWMHPNLQKLIASCNEHGIQLEILGLDQPYGKNTDKLLWMKEYSAKLPDDDLLLFVDAFDVLILADKREILSRFLALNVPMLMAAEKNGWPAKEAASFHSSTSSPFKYLNTGGYIGWVLAVKRWLSLFDETDLSGRSDQGAAYRLFAKSPDLYAVDHTCQIFLCLYQVPYDMLSIDRNRRVHSAYTDSSPCILHANNKSFHFWDEVYLSCFDRAPSKMDRQIYELVQNNPHQLSTVEYTYLANEIEKRSPCNVLVFGLGNDSALWHQINAQGKTLFLEHSQKWCDKILSKHPDLTYHFIRYHTKLSDWKLLLRQNGANLTIELPRAVKEIPWDIIFVDAPEGYEETQPGRMQSIYMASLLSRNKDCQIFVHDCDREVEKAYSSRFFKDAKLVRSIEKLRHYSR